MNDGRAMLPITGVYCAQLTPITAAGVPDCEKAVASALSLIASGCDGIALLGTTGEANSFGMKERMRLLEAFVSGGIPPARLLPGTGMPALADAAELTRHAISLGISTVIVLPPYYYKSPSREGLLAYYSQLVERVGDDRLRILLYHIPQVTQVPIGLDLILSLRERFPDTFIGIKDSGGDLANMRRLIDACPGFSVFSGADSLLRPLLEAGGAGSITATSNVLAAELAFIFNACHSARTQAVAEAERLIVAVRNISQSCPQIPAVRTMVALQTGDPIWLRPMPPFEPLSGKERDQLVQALAEIAAPTVELPHKARSFRSLRHGLSAHAFSDLAHCSSSNQDSSA